MLTLFLYVSITRIRFFLPNFFTLEFISNMVWILLQSCFNRFCDLAHTNGLLCFSMCFTNSSCNSCQLST